MRQPATIKDVARHARCGVATVSRVLNNTGPASAETRERVLAAVKELQFEFSEVGRSLQSSTTRTIGCVVPSIANPVYADAVQGVQETFHEAGYQTLLVCTNYDSEVESQAIRTLMAKQVDGFVLTVSDALSSQGLRSIQNREVPHCLLFNSAPRDEQGWSVDDYSAALRVVDEFVEMDHVHLGFLALKFKTSDRARQRYEGFIEGCFRNKLERPALLEVEEDAQNLDILLADFLKENPSVTGIFASNDILALATIRGLRAIGKHVPNDISVVGFDGIQVGEMVEPSLATVVTDPRMLGHGAAQTVLSVINKSELPDQPDPNFSFSFRHGGSLTHPRSDPQDAENVTAFKT